MKKSIEKSLKNSKDAQNQIVYFFINHRPNKCLRRWFDSAMFLTNSSSRFNALCNASIPDNIKCNKGFFYFLPCSVTRPRNPCSRANWAKWTQTRCAFGKVCKAGHSPCFLSFLPYPWKNLLFLTFLGISL